MSFGWSASDFVTLTKLAWKTYKSCKDAPDSFSGVSQEALSLHAVLKETEEVLAESQLSVSEGKRLKVITDGCTNVLKELDSLVTKYESLATSSKRAWDRMRYAIEDITELRSRLMSNTILLTAFLSYGTFSLFFLSVSFRF
jgi:hypothetical protein